MRRNRLLAVLTAAMLGCGCAGTSSPAVQTPEPSLAPQETAAAEQTDTASYHELMAKNQPADNYTAGVKRSYDMHFEDGSVTSYDLDGVIEDDGEQIHLTQHINSDGMQAEVEGWYDDGRLYMTYNGVSYYEDMDRNAVRDVMLAELDPYEVKDSELESAAAETGVNGTVWTLTLSPDSAEKLFDERYDIYGLRSYDDYEVTSGTITQKFDADGILTGEDTRFECTVSSNGIRVDITAVTALGFLNLNETDVSVSDAQREAFAAYVNYADIDTDAISEADITSDDPGATPEETFRKRLVNRLGYQLQADGTYFAEFNETESYRVDFEHSLFTYSNRTSHYVYNWKGDQGGFGDACSVDFRNGTHTEACEESALEQIETVRKYFAMELYYCGLSLDDLTDKQ